MSATRICLLATATLGCALTPPADCWAQAYGAHSVVENNDLRWFEPTQFDLDGTATRSRKGFTASIERVGWSITGERITIGDPNVVNPSERFYENNPDAVIQQVVSSLAFNLNFVPGNPNEAAVLAQIQQQTGVEFTGNTIEFVVEIDEIPTVVEVPEVTAGTGFAPPAPFNVENGIKDAAPDSDFAFGDRYEIGYSDGERGWRIGILDGPDLTQNFVYGAGPGAEYTSQSITGFANFHPFFGGTPQDLDQDGQLDTPGPEGDIYALGFGSVAVNFDAPADFFDGFRDYFFNQFPTAGVIYGPINNVTNRGGPDDDQPLTGGDNTIDGDVGVPDDINGNGSSFQVFTADLDGDGTIDDDEIIFTFIDFGDTTSFDIYFEDVTVRNRTQVDGIELMLTHQLNTQHKLERGRRDELELSYGLRYLELRDAFSWEGRGSALTQSGAQVEIDNQLIGPQIGLAWTRDHGAWDMIAEGRFMFAYNRLDRGLNGIMGEGLVPASTNRPINARSTTTVIGDAQDEFSPLAELRLEARYKFTKAIALNVGFTGTYIHQIKRASAAMRYTLPNFSLQDGRSDLFMMGVNGGIEFRY